MSDKKAKAVKPWLVLMGVGDGLLSVEYRGPDRKKAREVVERLLRAGSPVSVVREASRENLVPEDLKSSLPSDAF